MLVSFCVPPADAYSASTFLVIERPDRLHVYNKYQQGITPRERAVLTPFVPMRIVKANDLLGDGFTPCTTVEIGGELFYLVKGRDGELSGSAKAGTIRRFTDAEVLRDTIVVLDDRAIEFAPFGGDGPRPLRRGERFVRHFSQGERTCIGSLDQPPIYGFAPLPASGRRQTWDVPSTLNEPRVVIPEKILAAVRENLSEVNRVYRSLYSFFNQRTGQQRPAPHWTVTNARHAIVCTLVNRPADADVSQSTRYLVKDLENVLLGTKLRITNAADRIEIRMEQGE